MTAEGSKILIIEDEQEIRRFLRASLGVHGYRFVEAETGQQGLMLAASQQPDLIVLDLGLPDMDGIDVIPPFASGRRCRSSSSRPAARNEKKSRRSTPAPMII